MELFETGIETERAYLFQNPAKPSKEDIELESLSAKAKEYYIQIGKMKDLEDSENENEKNPLVDLYSQTTQVKEKREQIIAKILGSLYKGTIGDFTFRKNAVYYSRRRYPTNIRNLKLEDNELAKAIELIDKQDKSPEKEKSEVFEYLYKKIQEVSQEENYWNNKGEYEESENEKTLKLPKPIYSIHEIKEDDNDGERVLKINKIVALMIEQRSIRFLPKQNENRSVDVDNRTAKLLAQKYAKEIQEFRQKAIDKAKANLNEIKKDIQAIESRCEKQVMLLKLKGDYPA